MYIISKRKIAIILMALFSFVIAFEQPFGYSPDYTQYEFFFQQIRAYFVATKLTNRFEPGFFYISFWLTQVFNSDLFVYSVFVFFAIFVKFFYGLRDVVGNYFWMAVAFYFFKFFPLHELTQLRAALGASFMIAAFFYIEKGNRWQGILLCLIATSFHYSALMLAPFLFLPRLDRRQILLITAVIFFVCFIFASYLILLVGKNVQVFETYGDYTSSLGKLNRFSPAFFPEYFIILFSFYFWEKLTEIMRRVVAIEMIGYAIFYAFADYGVVAVRGREFFSVIWIFFVAQGTVTGAKARLGINIFVVLSIILGIYLFFSGNFFTDPSKWVE